MTQLDDDSFGSQVTVIISHNNQPLTQLVAVTESVYINFCSDTVYTASGIIRLSYAAFEKMS